MKKLIILLIFTYSIISFCESMTVVNNGGTRVLVVDSGTDFSHPEFTGKVLNETAEVSGTAGQDDDNNGYIDDVAGWNFVENNNTMVDTSILPAFYDEVLRYSDITEKYYYDYDSLTEDDFTFTESFHSDDMKYSWFDFIGGFSHGTHVAGIISRNNNYVSLKAIKYLNVGTAPSLDRMKEFLIYRISLDGRSSRQMSYEEIETYFKEYGDTEVAAYQNVSDYVSFCVPRVINCSYGDNRVNLMEFMKEAMVDTFGYSTADTEEAYKLVDIYARNVSVRTDEKVYEKATDALIIIAAGNEAENVDDFISSPIDMNIENKMVVAATFDDNLIADFSCYGVNKVDVAAPGVLIRSTYPNGKYGLMSGTSQATPYVSKIAARAFLLRNTLTPLEVKKIIMETVDKKDWLKDKVKTSGCVNMYRVEQAVRFMNQGLTIDQAIAKANSGTGTVRTSSRNIDLNDPLIQK
ncbi:MAG: S8 family serine peptidase, partial [Clostridia bacterium]|nr:S8 family serine peptidase [Clostridia bacterium]